jgi:hypothetical protein
VADNYYHAKVQISSIKDSTDGANTFQDSSSDEDSEVLKNYSKSGGMVQ